MKKLCLRRFPFALAAALTSGASFLSAAEITWQATFNLTNANQVSTDGTLVKAVNATSGGDSPTVNIGGENILFSAEDIAPSNTNTGTFFTGGGGTLATPNSTPSSTVTPMPEAVGLLISPDSLEEQTTKFNSSVPATPEAAALPEINELVTTNRPKISAAISPAAESDQSSEPSPPTDPPKRSISSKASTMESIPA